MSHTLSLPFLLPLRQKKVDSPPFLGLLASFLLQGMCMGMEKEMLGKGLLSKEQDEALNKMLRKGGQENTWNGRNYSSPTLTRHLSWRTRARGTSDPVMTVP